MTDTRELIERLNEILKDVWLEDRLAIRYIKTITRAGKALHKQAQEIESLKGLVERYKSALTSLAISPTPSMKPQYWKTIASEALQEESHD